MTTQTSTEIKAPKAGSKQAKLVAMLSRKNGVTLAKASEMLGWQKLPQSALGSKTPLQAMKKWHKLKPEMFKKRPYFLPGYDRYV